ncbi:MAG TPA: hypothetical protein VHY81_09480 [Acidimicrobiales bacterium]|nr:hypothetical protein [Acidimicrobiales bacterium]
MPGEQVRRLQSGFAIRSIRTVRALAVPTTLVATAALFASCGSSPSTSATSTSTTTSTHHAATTTTGPSTTLPPPATTGPLTPGAPIALPFAADRVTASESPDGAVFAAPQDPTNPAPAIAWVIDGNGPAAIAEHVATGIAALAADANNFYAATYSTVYAYDRASGNQNGQWNMPKVKATNSSDADLVALATGGGSLYVSVTQGNTTSVYRITPTSSAAPHLVVRGLGDAIGSDGTIYYERTDHHLAALSPGGTTTVGPALADAPNGEGGGVQYVEVVAAGAVWVSEPAGQGLDAAYTTYDTQSLARVGQYSGSVTSSVVDSASGPLVLQPSAGSPACAAAQPPAACVLRIDQHGTTSDPVNVGAAVTLIGPQPAVIVSDTTTGQFDLVRLS